MVYGSYFEEGVGKIQKSANPDSLITFAVLEVSTKRYISVYVRNKAAVAELPVVENSIPSALVQMQSYKDELSH